MSGDPHDGRLIRASLDAPEQFADIFERHYRVIDGYCCRRFGGDGHDVSAQTFVEAFGSRHRFEFDRADARPWLFGIVANLGRRHRRTEIRRLRAYARVDHRQAPEADLDARVDAIALGERLASALHGIPRRDRETLLLSAWADLSYEQIAEALAIPIGTVRSRLARARGRLRTALGDLVEDGEADEWAPLQLRGDEA